jgi:adenylosuccinate lyase
MANVTDGLIVHPGVIERRLAEELPFIATEDLMMAAVRGGADRQDIHEIIREASLEASREMKTNGTPNDLLDRLRVLPAFSEIDLNALLDPARYIGRAPEQVDSFLKIVISPIRARYAEELTVDPDLRV